MIYTRLKFILIGILLLFGGVAFIVAEVLIPGFLYGAALSGIGFILGPFALLFLGLAMIYLGISNNKKRHDSTKRKRKT